MAAAARQRGAGRIQIVEPHTARRDAALRLAADAAAVDSAGLDLPHGAEIIVEASGHPSAITDALDRIAVRRT
ncbi:hypothetical protein AB0M20_13180 [Actinoplanes sp. NPDC051633]|uniref:hypothetical protein n=1 Tax=Actinoplanes sp. NPDC051633 TaxID=3155670 RepID=UPI0034458ED4